MSISEETLEETLAPSVCKEVLEQEVWIIVDHWGREKSDAVFKQLYLRMDFRQWRSNTFRTILSTIWHFNGDSTDCSNNIGDSTKSET